MGGASTQAVLQVTHQQKARIQAVHQVPVRVNHLQKNQLVHLRVHHRLVQVAPITLAPLLPMHLLIACTRVHPPRMYQLHPPPTILQRNQLLLLRTRLQLACTQVPAQRILMKHQKSHSRRWHPPIPPMHLPRALHPAQS